MDANTIAKMIFFGFIFVVLIAGISLISKYKDWRDKRLWDRAQRERIAEEQLEDEAASSDD